MTIRRSQLTPGTKLGEGGQGAVYALEDDPTLVYKEYNPTIRSMVDRDVLNSLVALKDQINLENEPIEYWAAWPLDVVEDAGQTVGLIMPRIDTTFYFDGGGLEGRERSFMYLASPPKPAWGEVSLPDVDSQVAMLEKFAGVLQLLHHRQIVVGDISYANVLWGLPCRVFLLDCDSFVIDGRTVVGAPLSTDGWQDEQSAGLPMAPDQDNFKLGLFVYRVLTKSLHDVPTDDPQGQDLGLKDPEKTTAILDIMQGLSSPPGQRPSAQKVRHALQGRRSRPVIRPTRPPVAEKAAPEPRVRRWRQLDPTKVTSTPRPEVPSFTQERRWRPIPHLGEERSATDATEDSRDDPWRPRP